MVNPIASVNHTPVQLWSERAGEVSWRCSCGTVNKHVPVGPRTQHANLICINNDGKGDSPDRVFRNV